MIVIGINAYHPDASVVMFKNGQLVWAGEEERYNRVKHSSGFPESALRKCFEETLVNPLAVDAIAVSKNPRSNLLRKISYALRNPLNHELCMNRVRAFRKIRSISEAYRETLNIPTALKIPKVHYVEHHHAHIASSFYLSGFEHAAFLSLDGLGDFSSAMWGFGNGTALHVYDRIHFPHSAGFLYMAATQYLGFPNFGDEYKVMGLAAYGLPRYNDIFQRMYKLKRNGRFELNLDYFIHHRGHAKVRWEGGVPDQDIIFSRQWTKDLGEPRLPDAPIVDRDKDIAASLQIALENIYFHILNHLYSVTRESNLCLAGGVAYNSLANGKITKQTPFRNIFIQPAAGDSGTAVGAAAYATYREMGYPRQFTMDHAYWGSRSTRDNILAAIRKNNLSYEVMPDDTALVSKTARAIAAGKVVGWFQGRMEFGPRALGNRSILADPRRHDMKAILNERIKHRETFRPFAPAVVEEKASTFFDMDCKSSPFMLRVFSVKPDKRNLLPAITHVDGTARVQTVSRVTNHLFWKLISEFGSLTGIPVLLNTSFNENEPIVCTPAEAVDCFVKTKMDMLVLDHYVIERNSNADPL